MGCTNSVPAAPPAGRSEAIEEFDTQNVGFEKIYKLGKVLGEGAFSVVKLGTHKKTGKQYAIKCIARNGLPEDDERLE